MTCSLLLWVAPTRDGLRANICYVTIVTIARHKVGPSSYQRLTYAALSRCATRHPTRGCPAAMRREHEGRPFLSRLPHQSARLNSHFSGCLSVNQKLRQLFISHEPVMQMLSNLKDSFTGWISRTCFKVWLLKFMFSYTSWHFCGFGLRNCCICKKRFCCSKHHRMGRKLICNQKSWNFCKFWLKMGGVGLRNFSKIEEKKCLLETSYNGQKLDWH